MNLNCIVPDVLEPNETAETARTAAPGQTHWLTLYPGGDVDWFSFPDMPLTRVSLWHDPGFHDGTETVRLELYRDGELFKELAVDGNSASSFTSYVQNNDTSVHDWLIRITSNKPASHYYFGFIPAP